MQNVFHANRLRKDPENPLPGQVQEPPEKIVINGEPEYRVDEIIASRLHYRKLQYRANWTGCDPDNQWYNINSFIGSPYRVKEFHDKYPDKAGPPTQLQHWLTPLWLIRTSNLLRRIT